QAQRPLCACACSGRCCREDGHSQVRAPDQDEPLWRYPGRQQQQHAHLLQGWLQASCHHQPGPEHRPLRRLRQPL
ncbi:hypothetical protein N0V84_012483, partial [Fusarium piperis]